MLLARLLDGVEDRRHSTVGLNDQLHLAAPDRARTLIALLRRDRLMLSSKLLANTRHAGSSSGALPS